MYARITEHEIVLPSKGSRGTSRGTGETQGMRLAAAVGLTQLLLPFRCHLNQVKMLGRNGSARGACDLWGQDACERWAPGEVMAAVGAWGKFGGLAARVCQEMHG